MHGGVRVRVLMLLVEVACLVGKRRRRCEFRRRRRADQLTRMVYQVPGAILLEHGSERPAVAVEVPELLLRHVRVELHEVVDERGIGKVGRGPRIRSGSEASNGSAPRR